MGKRLRYFLYAAYLAELHNLSAAEEESTALEGRPFQVDFVCGPREKMRLEEEGKLSGLR